jgi:hypothetical protein
MAERQFGNFRPWPLNELIEKERSFTVGDMRGAELKAEIKRRRPLAIGGIRVPAHFLPQYPSLARSLLRLRACLSFIARSEELSIDSRGVTSYSPNKTRIFFMKQSA